MSTTHTQIATWADEYVTAKNEIATLESRLKILKENLQMNVPAGTEFSGDGRRVVHTVFQQTTLNTALVKSHFPDVYTECAETKDVTRLTVR